MGDFDRPRAQATKPHASPNPDHCRGRCKPQRRSRAGTRAGGSRRPGRGRRRQSFSRFAPTSWRPRVPREGGLSAGDHRQRAVAARNRCARWNSARPTRRISPRPAAAGIAYMSTPFDADSATHLVRRIGVSTLKVGSGDLTNAPLLLHLARFRLPIILLDRHGDAGGSGAGARRHRLRLSRRRERADRRRPILANLLLDRETWTELRARVIAAALHDRVSGRSAVDQSARDGDAARCVRASGRLLRSQQRAFTSRQRRSRSARS